jgi:16S rRNA (uracil1498-N3)-methyltransferase
MRLHRFYIPPNTIELKHDFWLHDNRVISQWRKVLRYQIGQEVVLFDGLTHDRLYRIEELTEREAHLMHVTDLQRKTPEKEIYLFWSLLKKDKNDWVLQKCTELGVSHFVPLLADRSEKTGFNVERAQKILIEAAEQCGRSDIPTVRDPLTIETVFAEFEPKMPLFICEQDSGEADLNLDQAGVFIGPEGGWSNAEKQLFKDKNVVHLHLNDFTLRAETAAVSAVTKLIH